MGDRLSWYVTSRPGQLSLAISLWVGTMSTSLGWEGNRRSGVALAMRQTVVVYAPTGSMAYEREMSTPSTLLVYGSPLPLLFVSIVVSSLIPNFYCYQIMLIS